MQFSHICFLIILCTLAGTGNAQMSATSLFFYYPENGARAGMANVTYGMTPFSGEPGGLANESKRLFISGNYPSTWYKWDINWDARYWQASADWRSPGMGHFGIQGRYLRMSELRSSFPGSEPYNPYQWMVSLRRIQPLNSNWDLGVAIHYYYNFVGMDYGDDRVYSNQVNYSLGLSRKGIFPNSTQQLSSGNHSQSEGKDPESMGMGLGIYLLHFGPPISYRYSNRDSRLTNREAIPQRIIFAWHYYAVDWENGHVLLVLNIEKQLIDYSEDFVPEPFYKALFTGWSNDKSSEEKKDVIYRGAIRIRVAPWLTLSSGVYRHPLKDGLVAGLGDDDPYLYWTGGFALHWNNFTVSAAGISGKMDPKPWEAMVSISWML